MFNRNINNFSSNNTNTSSNSKIVPEARQALDRMKYEIANELNINLQNGYNGNLTARDAGRIGGNMVKKLIEQQQRQMANKFNI